MLNTFNKCYFDFALERGYIEKLLEMKGEDDK